MRSLLLGLVMAVAVSGLVTDTTDAAVSDEAMAQVIANSLKESGRLKDYRVDDHPNPVQELKRIYELGNRRGRRRR